MYSVKEKYQHKLRDSHNVQLQCYRKMHTASLKRRIILGERLRVDSKTKTNAQNRTSVQAQ